MNVNFGLSNYKNIDFMMKMANQLKLKKRLNMLRKENPNKETYYKAQI
jgi:hypothetical protein